MGYDALAGIFFALATPLIILGFVVFWVMTSRDRAELEEIWRRYAESRGLVFVPAEGEWPNRTNPAVRWSNEDASFEIAARGREARVRTRVSARPEHALLGTLRVVAEGGTLAVDARPKAIEERVVTDAVRRELLAFHQRERAVLTYRRGKIALEWRGGERNDARLDEARRLAEHVARTVDEAFSVARS